MRKKKSGKSFYIIALAVLLGAGIITAVSTTADKEKETEKTTSRISLSDSANLDNTASINEPLTSKIEEIPSQKNESLSNEESEPETDTSKTESEPAQSVATDEFLSFQLPIEGTIIKQYDLEKLQYSATFGDMRLHSGIDILAVAGTPVTVTANGTVKSIEEDALMGTVVTLEHAGGYESIYCGLEEIKFAVGEEVKIGKVLGVVGEVPSECLDEDHLHFEIKKEGENVSPLDAVNMQ